MANETQGNPRLAPEYARHRTALVAADGAGAITDRKRGINMASYSHAHIQVIPTGGANPDVEVLWWSEVAEKFVSEHTAIAKSGTGANAPYEFTVESRGRIMFVKAIVLAAGSVEIMVAGYNVERV